MLIKVSSVTLNVTGITKFIVEPIEKTTFKRVKLFKRIKESNTTWNLTLYYKDIDGQNAQFTWWGAKSHAEIEAVEKELINQIKEVELDHMSATLENAIRGN